MINFINELLSCVFCSGTDNGIYESYLELKEKNKMPMSKDRVEFTVTWDDTNWKQTVDAVQRAFNISYYEAEDIVNARCRIRCRPSQFGRFIVYRVEEGVRINQVRNLNPKIIQVEPQVEIVDMSKNKHRG